MLYYEHFHGDNGRGVGASHQTGWTALVTRCLEKTSETAASATPNIRMKPPPPNPRTASLRLREKHQLHRLFKLANASGTAFAMTNISAAERPLPDISSRARNTICES